MAGRLGIDRLGYWAKEFGFGAPTGVDLPGEVKGIVRPTVEEGCAGPADLPGRDLPGRHRPGLRRGHADPADQRLRGARQRRHPLQAPDRQTSSGRTAGRPAVQAPGDPQADRPGERPQDHAQGGPQRRPRAPHVQPGRLPSGWPASPAPRSSARATATAGCRQLLVHRLRAQGPEERQRSTAPARSWWCSRSRTTRARSATSRPRS